MVKLPPEFTATMFPGYFWNVDTQTLFSLKISGELRELRLTLPNHWNRLQEPAYRVSVEGRRRNLYLSYLKGLVLTDSEISVK